MPYRYVCEGCGNTVEASTVERRVRGSNGFVRVCPPVECEGCDKVMEGERFERERPEVRP